ncbi:MAG: methyltransferase domain-containing protein [Gallionellaceae bacterium]|nr:methyltransferase domain-containing protein [Gallionellaceae bacterium]
MLFGYWRRYLKGAPEYLARHYWWTYLSPSGVWFFDHDCVINLILFGKYRVILNEVSRRYSTMTCDRTLQLTCAYGALSPTLAQSSNTREFHVIDVASIQLEATRSKLKANFPKVNMVRMNVESLAYSNDSFDCIVIFFLLHELPAQARERALSEAIRLLKPKGQLLIAEYGENLSVHWLHRFTPWCWILGKLEPFLHDFWHSNLTQQLAQIAVQQNKPLCSHSETSLFNGFYRVIEYRV